MTIELFTKALILGIINAAPIGPVGLLCLKKNSTGDRLSGIATALGMAVAYGIISFCVLFGMKWMQGLLESWRCPLELLAGAALVFMGLRGLRTDELKEKQPRRKSRLAGDFLSSFAMTLFNPVPFATFTVFLTTFKILRGKLGLIPEIEFSLTVFLGTLTFWLVVNHLLHRVKQRSNSDYHRWLSKGAAVVLIAFGTLIFGAGVRLGFTLLNS